MKHIKKISTVRADAFLDFFNAMYRAWEDFKFAKKNEFSF
jgi:hypothetical protein